MECNKDEAFRAKSIAEEKLEKKDFVGAKKFAMKAQTLYQELDGISQLLTTVDVYLSYEKKISGEVDWYGVLDVNPSADEETIKKHYRKYALVLHPDKNKSAGADGAFQLISQAWSLLSDKDKRLAYNQRRGLRGVQQKVSLHGTGQAYQFPPNGVFNFGYRATATPEAQTAAQTAQSGPSGVFSFGNGQSQTPKDQTTGETSQSQPNGNGAKAKSNSAKAKSNGAKVPRKTAQTPPPRADTFWTMCDGCNFHYEYVRLYLNGALLCQTCNKPFRAKETGPPPNPSSSSTKVPQEQQQASGENVPNQNPNDSGKKVKVAKTRPAHNQNDHDTEKNSPAAKKSRRGPIQDVHDSENNVQVTKKSGKRQGVPDKDPVKNAMPADNSGPRPAQELGKNVQSGTVSGLGQAGSNSVRKANYQKVEGFGTANHGSTGHSSAAKAATVKQAQSKSKRAHSETTVFGPGGLQQFIKKRRPDNENSRNQMNHDLAQADSGFVTGSAPRSNGFSGIHHQPSSRDFKPHEWRNMMMVKARNEVQSKLNMWRSQDKEKDISKESMKDGTNESSMNGKMSKGNAEAAAMTVPDPDFHDFDKDRTGKSFGDNEVWAVYDDNDGMPRLYALIHKVISRKPLKLRMSWLNSKTNNEFGSMDWVSSGFFKTCGEFRVGKWTSGPSIRVFSQKINWCKGMRGNVLIYPQENDVWALYKNWSLEWDINTPGDVVYKYDMVMVLDKYQEEEGVSVAPLVKVAGFKTVFRPNLDPQAVKRIPKEEMFQFSHRVPHYMLTGQESQDAPAGSLELDPAAVPLELLTVIKEANVDPIASSDNANGGA